MLQMWTMKLIESIKIYYVSVRVARTIKVNIKETFMGNYGSQIKYFFGKGRIPATLGNSGPILRKADISNINIDISNINIDIWQSIIL